MGERTFTFEGYILGIHGKIGPYSGRQTVQNIGVYYLAPVKETENLGSMLPTFYEEPDMKFPPVVKINQIRIYHGYYINSLQVQYQLLDGSTRLGEKHGTDIGNHTIITFEHGEELVKLKGKVVPSGIIILPGRVLGQITFISQKKDGTTAVYGPFGKTGDEEKPITASGHMLGFAGGTFNGYFVTSLRAFFA